MKNLRKDFITKEKINPIVINAVNSLGSMKSVAEKIGKSPMAFSQIKNLQSLPALETLGALRVLYGLSVDAVIDGNELNVFDSVNTSNLMRQIEELKNERNQYKERAELYEKILKKENFPDVDMTNRFVDDLDELSKLDDVTRNLFLGNSYYSEIIGNA